MNFLACQLFALFAAFWFRLYLSPSHANPLVRHAVATLLGIAFLIFCFGWYRTILYSTLTQYYSVQFISQDAATLCLFITVSVTRLNYQHILIELSESIVIVNYLLTSRQGRGPVVRVQS